jgi:secreted Zn-dependent insulinase-like peptidase
VKEKLLQEWYNFYYEQSYRQGIANFENIVVTNAYEKNTMRKILETFTFEDLLRIAQDWMNSGRLVWFIHGNITKDTAVQIAEKARETLNLIPVDKEDLVDLRCIALAPNS